MLRLLASLALCFAPLAAAAQTVIANVDGHTLDGEGREVRFTGLVIGADGKVAQLIGPGDPAPAGQRIDMHGRTLLPGMIDSHGHVMDLGLQLRSLDLTGTRSLAEALAKVAAYVRANPGNGWIRGGGWNQELWGLGRFPTAAELDAVTGDRPVWLERIDGHAAWGNSAALRAAGVTRDTVAPHGGRIERLADGAPSGVFVDAALDLVTPAIPLPTEAERIAAFRAAQQALLGFGITATTDMGTLPRIWDFYGRMGAAGALRLRIFAYASGVESARAIGGAPSPWRFGDRLRLVGIKLYADGALGSRGAWLKRPYADAPDQSGLGFLSDAELQEQMRAGAAMGLQIAVHAIGDRANAQVLDAIDAVAPVAPGDRRWRIEHAQIVDPADLPRFAAHGTIASMQPVHETSDRLMAEKRLDSPRLAGAYAWASMLRLGSRLAFGSDYPVESPDPWAGWAAGVTRQDAEGQPPGGWRPEERLTRAQAWAAFTTGGAYAAFAEDRIGRLAPGYWADFVVLDRDPTTAAPADVRGTRVLETWVGGERVWVAGE